MHNRTVVMTRCIFSLISHMPILPLYLHKNRHSVFKTSVSFVLERLEA